MCALISFTHNANAQQPTPWIEFAPTDEHFSVLMPQAPKAAPVTDIHGELHVGGVWYSAADRLRFLSSFKAAPQIAPIQLGDSKPAISESEEPIFTTKEVDQRPRILEKPEPAYTEGARLFGVQGTVILRAVLSKTGEVTKIHVIKRLPHGLTERSLDAVRAIKFAPAQKDSTAVSIYIQLEYNFNLF